MIKRVDTAVYNAIEQAANDDFQAGFQVFGLAEDGVDYSKSNPDLLTEDLAARIDEAKEQIIAGEITVPEEPEGS
jgi:basic membrane protein A